MGFVILTVLGNKVPAHSDPFHLVILCWATRSLHILTHFNLVILTVLGNKVPAHSDPLHRVILTVLGNKVPAHSDPLAAVLFPAKHTKLNHL